MAGHGAKLDRKWELAIACLLSEPTVELAAKKANVGYRTLKEWLTLPEFQAAYRQARQSVLDHAITRLVGACGKAVETLASNLDEGRPGEQTRAALGILTQATRGVELLDLAERLRLLEERAHAADGLKP